MRRSPTTTEPVAIVTTPTSARSVSSSSSESHQGGGVDQNNNNATTPRPDSASSSAIVPPSSSSSSQRVQFTGAQIDDHLDKLLECPVCYDLILPPIVSCGQGHNCCNSCRSSIDKCPVCRGEFIGFRNLFAEQLIEQCQFQCKHGCNANLPAKELSIHYQTECCFRPILCRECDSLIPFDDYLQHVELVDKLERQLASECSTGFEIDEEDLISHPVLSQLERRVTVWEPTWMNCYAQDFFCSLDFNGQHWWIWVASLTETGCKMKCQVILWSREKSAEHSYFGTIHSIRSSPDAVLQSGECLILTKTALKNFMHQGGIDVLVRIEPKYVVPKTRRGVDVQSPLEIMNPSMNRTHWTTRGGGNGSTTVADSNHTPIRSVRVQESRIPISVPTMVSLSSQLPSSVEPTAAAAAAEPSIDNPPVDNSSTDDNPVPDPSLSSLGSTNTARRILFDTIPSSRGVSSTASSGRGGLVRYRFGRGIRHGRQRPLMSTQSIVETIDLTIAEE